MTEPSNSAPVALAAASSRTDATARPDRAAGLSPHARRLLDQAGAALQQNRPADAGPALTALAALAPDHPEVLRMRAIALHMERRFSDAVPLLQRAVQQWPDDSLLHNNLGSSLGEAGDVEGALTALRRSVELAPDLATTWFNLGRALDLHGRVAEAHEAFANALERDAEHLHARISYARTLQMIGRIDESKTELRRAIAARPDSARAWYGLSTLRTADFDAEDTRQMERVYAQPGHSGDERTYIGFALAKAYEDQDRYPEAFAVLLAANAAKRRHLDWNAASFSLNMDAIANAFGPASPPAADPAFGSEVVFIVSLPRSGSTLAEQILAAHPDVEGANELTDLPDLLNEESTRRRTRFKDWAPRASAADWERLGRRYLERTAHWRERHPVSTDKALSNWHYIGAAQAMLPGARFINCRRDPVETCLSCFRQLFAREQAYTYDLTEMAAFARDYDRLMRHWHRLYPGKILDFVYEDLLADPEGQTRRLLDFCKLPFDPACLRFHEAERTVRTASAAQVREPLRNDTPRAVRYGKLLEPLRRALGATA